MLTLTNNTNQIILGTTNTQTITSASLSSSEEKISIEKLTELDNLLGTLCDRDPTEEEKRRMQVLLQDVYQ
jgi:hypothetical protein